MCFKKGVWQTRLPWEAKDKCAKPKLLPPRDLPPHIN